MTTRYAALIFSILLTYSACMAGQLRGTVADASGKPIASASVKIENSTYGVITNLNGEYFLELKPGSYQIVFQSLGYIPKSISITIENEVIVKHIVLEKSVIQLAPITITANGDDPAYAIIKSAIKNKDKYYRQVQSYQCETYGKSNTESEEEVEKIDSASFALVTTTNKKRMQFIESISTVYYKEPRTFKEVKHAYQDHTKHRTLDFGNQAQISFTLSPAIEDYGPPQYGTNSYLFYNNISDVDFSFYQNLVDLPQLYDKPFVSPIATSALLTYQYKLISSFMEDSVLVHKILVEPRRSTGPYFSGYIYIVDDLWCIKAVEFEVAKNALNIYEYFKMFVNYQLVDQKYWLPQRQEFFYNSNEGPKKLIGHSVIIYSDYKINPDLPKDFFNNALSVIEDDAEEKGLEFWSKYRPITLQPDELGFVKTQDSIRTYYASAAYMAKADSSYNQTGIWDFLIFGVGHRNSMKGYSIFFDPIISQIRPFAVGGYRHALSGNFSKTFENKKSFKVRGEVNYGFLNHDIRGKGLASYMYDPLKFSEVEVGGGSIYEMVNSYNSIAATFSRGNYTLKQHALIGYKREWFNGFYMGARLEWSDQKSLEGYTLANWSNTLFGDLNKPTPFERYTKMELEVNATIRFKQEYYLRPNQKIIKGSKYPQVHIHYKWGIPNILGSMVHYQFLEVRVSDAFKIGSMGQSKYNVYAGSFIKSQPQRFIDNKFFRGSDRFFYSNPLYSFQLLGPTISTSKPYLQGHYIHHFNGAIFDKIPYLNRLSLRSVFGAGMLLEYSNRFAHYETFVGLERVFSIRNEMFKIGLYYVTAHSTYSNLDARFKVGIDFYNAFTHSWNY
ncbi:hypothetical protein GC194_10285 [bacterium]|nr:hypothetical protein [bacterium]